MPNEDIADAKPAPAPAPAPVHYGAVGPAGATAPARKNARAQTRRLQAAKLLRSKWTATVPLNKEKHFIVTALVSPDVPGGLVDAVTIEAVLTGRSFTLRWRELNDAAQWLQGWR
ncbi:TIGR02450 family Trp-rich protein [Massilia glaciei]|uniref:TIGR02450 family Trp-rich protein n=1 Tax=Massilia glaciei TaxID=1524097 RepID=A0A2U2HNX3_9BURK|nr:TIGR02450 family Trp-rich protein [Massilia glaciei]PWF49115.1 TIGR02450 family Trp-rich protein [Massilia glaciei]